MQEVEAKKIIHKFQHNGLNWFGLDYNMNLYRGCCHGCIYCDSRSECYGIENFDRVRVKKNCINLLAKELKGKRSKGVIGIGAMGDPYNPYEKQHKYTRNALEWINHFHFGISVITKSPLITRDIDILSKINAHSPVIAKLTITAAEDELSRRIEPSVNVSSERFSAVKLLVESGIFTGIMLMPLLPFITDTEENIINIVRKAHAHRASFIFPSFGVTLRGNQRDYFFTMLDKRFPGLKSEYIKTYGENYACSSPKEKTLKALFRQECHKSGILYKMPDIIAAYKTEKEFNPF